MKMSNGKLQVLSALAPLPVLLILSGVGRAADIPGTAYSPDPQAASPEPRHPQTRPAITRAPAYSQTRRAGSAELDRPQSREAASATVPTQNPDAGTVGPTTQGAGPGRARQGSQADWVVPRGAPAYRHRPAYPYEVPGATPYGQDPYGRGPYQPVPYDRRFPSTPAGQ
jgi:hypothetical protein